MDKTSIEVAAKAKYARLKFEMGEDKNLTWGPVQFTLSFGESALYLSTMGDPVTGVAPVEFVKILFGKWEVYFWKCEISVLLTRRIEQERLPYAEGWRPSAAETNLASLALMVQALIAASEEPEP